MDERRFRQVDDLFQRALERDAAERSAFLRGASEDSTIVREVRVLLGAHERGESFLETPALGAATSVLGFDAAPAASAPVGTRIGAWRIVSVIAVGGMGAVYRAERDDDAYEQTAAIKLIRRGAIGSSRLRGEALEQRFQIERQVLASLDHPNIARMLDGGAAEDGRPYFVMEYVEGLPIDRYCDGAGLGVEERIDLFMRVCDAVQHAHQNLVIHRDLKPANVLVTPEGTPKLLDFGLAKLLDPHRVGAMDVTADGGFMGTITYAAPEQVAPGSDPPDTRTDVYALGLILYRLLARRHAFDAEAGVAEIIDRICTETPRPPSHWRRDVGSELDTIVLKALSKAPERRYESAGQLRDDLERHRAGAPILARADSGWYVLRKTLQRHRRSVAAVAATVLFLALFGVFATTQAMRLERQRDALERSLRISNIERGRAAIAIGNATLAERLIWAEHLAAPDEPLARWALRELYMHEPCLRTIDVSMEQVCGIAISDDGRYIAATDADRRPEVYDAETGEHVLSVDVSITTEHAVVFEPGTHVLVAATNSGEIVFHDVERDERVRTLEHPEHMRGLHFAGGGSTLVTLTFDGLTFRDPVDGTASDSIDGAGEVMRIAALSHDETLVAIGYYDGRVRLYDMATRGMVAEFFSTGQRNNALAFSPDDRYLAADYDGASIAIIDVETRRIINTLHEINGWIRSLNFHPSATDPPLLVGSGYDQAVILWEVPSGRVARRFNGHREAILKSVFTPDGSRLVSGSNDATLRVWETDPMGGRRTFADPGSVFDVEFTPDGRSLVSGSGDGDASIRVRDPENGEVLRTLAGHAGVTSAVACSPDGRLLASCGYDRSVRLWSLETDGASPIWSRAVEIDGDGLQYDIAFAGDGSLLAAGADDGCVRIWRVSDGALLRTVDLDCWRIPSIAATADADVLLAATMSPDSLVRIDVRTGAATTIAAFEKPVRALRPSPDGRSVAVGGNGLTVRVLSLDEADAGATLAILEGHSQDIFAIAYAPDGSLLATASRSGRIRVWDAATGQCLITLPGHSDMVFDLAFGPKGERLYSAARDRTIGCWDLDYYDRHIRGNLDSQARRARR